MKPKLTFFGGVKEIGGNKILLEDKGTRIFFDFGMSFGKRGKFFEEFLTPRTANGIGDFINMGLIPDIPGLYREGLLTHFGRKAEMYMFFVDLFLKFEIHFLSSLSFICFLGLGNPFQQGQYIFFRYKKIR
jgi:hypothetical protein